MKNNLDLNDPKVKEILLSSPAGFAWTISNGEWQLAPHLKVLNRYLTRLAARDITRLIITLPPRHGKSSLISQYFPVWYLGTFPEHRVILASYGSEFASDWGRKARDIMQEYGGLFNLQVRTDSSAADRWNLVGHAGGMNTTGVGGSLTGKGADCFPSGTMISTIDGDMDIAKLAMMDSPPLVLAFDIKKNKYVYRSIVTSRKIESNDLIEITTKNGRRIVSTNDHPYYIVGKGYVCANKISIGDRFISENKKQTGKDYDFIDMQSLRQGIHLTKVRIRQETKEEAERCILLGRMLQKSPCNQECGEMPPLRKSETVSSREKVLLKRLFTEGQSITEISTHENYEDLWKLQQRISSKESSYSILWEDLRKSIPLHKHDWCRKLSFYRWQELHSMVFKNPTDYYGTGRFCMCDMRCFGNLSSGNMEKQGNKENFFSCTSYRRESNEQYPRESSNSLQEMSSESTQIKYDTVSVVRSLRVDNLPVYDLQIEGTNNFFANGILVHNCLIIDDPIKDANEANSLTMRERAWDWWLSTAYTRLHPDGVVVIILTRWHQDDLAGRIMSHAEEDIKGSKWELIRMPAIAEEDEDWGVWKRKKGEALWTNRYSLKDLEVIRHDQTTRNGAYWWDCTPPESPILMADWTEKPISQISVGDEIVGFDEDGDHKKATVKNVFSKEAEVYEFMLESGRIVRCTEDHRWYTTKQDKLYDKPEIGSDLFLVDLCSNVRDKITSKRSLGYQKVYALETTTGNYVVWGYASSNSLYQQRPTAAEGRLFTRDSIRYYSDTWVHEDGVSYQAYKLHRKNSDVIVKKEDCYNFITVDLASSLKEQADFTVVATWAVTSPINEDGERCIILLDMKREKLEGPDQPNLIISAVKEYDPVAVYVEAVAYQMTLVQLLRRKNIPVAELIADKKKEIRAIPASMMMKAEQVFFPKFGANVPELEQELLAFPNGTHDDMADVLGYACRVLSNMPSKSLGIYLP